MLKFCHLFKPIKAAIHVKKIKSLLPGRMSFQLEISKFVPPGDGMGYYNGKAVFVPGTTIGDVIEVEPLKEKKRFITGSVKEIISPGPDRIQPECPHFDSCGGCSLMHLSYEKQLSLKKEMLEEVFQRYEIKIKPDIVPSPETFRFRYRTQLKCKNGIVGFSAAKTNQLVSVPDCKILSGKIHSSYPSLSKLGRVDCDFFLLESYSRGDIATSVTEGKNKVPLPGYSESILEDYGFGKLKLYSSDFAQSNPFITSLIIGQLLKECGSGKEITELYCGSGTFSAALAKKASHLTGYDFSDKAIATAKENASLNNLDNIEFKSINLDKYKKLKLSELVVVDPPRKGMHELVVKKIGNSKAGKLVYVSCNPATMARDIKDLMCKYSFEMEKITAYDMYCHSTHLEAVAVLQRR